MFFHEMTITIHALYILAILFSTCINSYVKKNGVSNNMTRLTIYCQQNLPHLTTRCTIIQIQSPKNVQKPHQKKQKQKLTENSRIAISCIAHGGPWILSPRNRTGTFQRVACGAPLSK